MLRKCVEITINVTKSALCRNYLLRNQRCRNNLHPNLHLIRIGGKRYKLLGKTDHKPFWSGRTHLMM